MASGTTCSAPSITVARVVENKRVGFQSRLHHLGFQVMSGVALLRKCYEGFTLRNQSVSQAV